MGPMWDVIFFRSTVPSSPSAYAISQVPCLFLVTFPSYQRSRRWVRFLLPVISVNSTADQRNRICAPSWIVCFCPASRVRTRLDCMFFPDSRARHVWVVCFFRISRAGRVWFVCFFNVFLDSRAGGILKPSGLDCMFLPPQDHYVVGFSVVRHKLYLGSSVRHTLYLGSSCTPQIVFGFKLYATHMFYYGSSCTPQTILGFQLYATNHV